MFATKATELYPNIPQLTLATLKRYVEDGLPTGGFLRAVLSNNLFEAVMRADDWNSVVLKEIAQYIYWELPRESWGSEEIVDAWIEQHSGT